MLKRWFLVGIIELCLVAWCGVWGAGGVLADCKGDVDDIWGWNSSYSKVEQKPIIKGLKDGESVCTMTGEYRDIVGVEKCIGTKLTIIGILNDELFDEISDWGDMKSMYDDSLLKNDDVRKSKYFCEDSVVEGLRVAQIRGARMCDYGGYVWQDYTKAGGYKISPITYGDIWLDINSDDGRGYDGVCKDEYTVARCSVTGELIKRKCSSDRVCKIIAIGESELDENPMSACVKNLCEENGVKAVNGEKKCVPEDESINSLFWVKKCVLGEYKEIEKCSSGCTDNNGAAKCLESDEVECELEDGTTLNSKATTCLQGNIWGCIKGEDIYNGTLKQLKECKDSTPNCVIDTRSSSIGSSAYCTNKTEGDYTEEERKYTLFFSITTSNGFWCKPANSTDDKGGINTALGCIPITAQGLVDNLLPTLFGLAGVLSFLMMVFGFIMVATSSGDEKKLQEAKQRITSAIIGLLLSIFALVIYRMIAVNILQIPGIK